MARSFFSANWRRGLRFGSQELDLPRVAVAAGLFGGAAVVGQLMGVDAGE